MNSGQYDIWDDFYGKKLLLIALILSLLTHGVITYYTLPGTYDAYVHMFFADHYARFWFEPWDYRWYTGFLTISYPPLVHQIIALLSFVFPLKVAFAVFANFILLILIIGIYRFTKIFFDKITAGVAAILTVVLSSIVETLHVYGQMPTLTGLAFLLNSLPFLYQYFVKPKAIYLVMAMSFLAVTISSHHVTAIFGMVFFIAPTLFMAAADGPSRKDAGKSILPFLWSVVISAWNRKKELILFGVLMVTLAIGLIFPYWYWSKSDPITQVSIPHGSRDNFFQKTSSGLIFYVIPLLLVFALLPAISFVITKKKRYLGWAVSFYLCLLFGSGGTTPIPKIMLGANAFNILTLDRFGFWASIMSIPFMAKFIYSFLAGPVRDFWVKNFGSKVHFMIIGLSGSAYFFFVIFIFHLGSFRPLQPKSIDVQPIINFLNRDDHMRWRFLTLGFGDQMAWLSSNTLAATVDGNYHSARRLPELTTRPVERLENAKFNGEDGLASLTDFLSNSEKYSLKYVFSNDRYYDPLLFYSGWSRTIQLENGIMVWEKGNISTIKNVSPTPLHKALKNTWGVFPVMSLVVTFLLTMFYLKRYKNKDYFESVPEVDHNYPLLAIYGSSLLPLVFFSGFILYQLNELLFLNEQKDPETAVLNYYNHLDFQRFETAFGFFKPTPTYTLDQYLLEKSVNDGGLMPSFAKLDSIHVTTLKTQKTHCLVLANTFWRTSLGKLAESDTLELSKVKNKWYIIPQSIIPEIPPFQMRSYTFTLYKKQGKRMISSFPTIKDDRVKKPFAAFEKANLISSKDELYLTGKLINADDIPINVALKAVVEVDSGKILTYYPGKEFQYNLWPKASTFFQISLNGLDSVQLIKIKKISLYAETDVSESGYIHGGTLGYKSVVSTNEKENLVFNIFNELSVDITIPGVLIAEQDKSGIIRKVELVTHKRAVRSGLNIKFSKDYIKAAPKSQVVDNKPIELFINGTKRTKISIDQKNESLTVLPYCFISQPIYLQ